MSIVYMITVLTDLKKKRPVLSVSNLLLPGSTIYTDLLKKLYIHQYECKYNIYIIDVIFV